MKFFIVGFLLLFNSYLSHDVQVATFTISNFEDEIRLDIILEHEDIVKTFAERQIVVNEKEIKNYLSQNLDILLNKEVSKLRFDSIEKKSHHIYVSGKIENQQKKINTIQIKNTCLLNIEEHSNVIQIRLNNQERDFLMTDERLEIFVSLN